MDADVPYVTADGSRVKAGDTVYHPEIALALVVSTDGWAARSGLEEVVPLCQCYVHKLGAIRRRKTQD